MANGITAVMGSPEKKTNGTKKAAVATPLIANLDAIRGQPRVVLSRTMSSVTRMVSEISVAIAAPRMTMKDIASV